MVHPPGRPAGSIVGTLPDNIAVHPTGKFAAVMNCGYGPHDVVVVDLTAGKISSRAVVSNSFYGVAFSADGRELYCSGGGDEMTIDSISWRVKLPMILRSRCMTGTCGCAVGLAVNLAGTKLFTANVWGNCVSKWILEGNPKHNCFSVRSRPSRGPADNNSGRPPYETALRDGRRILADGVQRALSAEKTR